MSRKIIFRSYSNREIDCDADLYAQDRNENLKTTGGVVETNDCKISFYVLIDDGSNFPLKAKMFNLIFDLSLLHAHYKLTV